MYDHTITGRMSDSLCAGSGMRPSDNDEWEVDGPDESVGIFGTTIVHVPCMDDDGGPDASLSEDVTRVTVGDVVRVTLTYTCPACGATFTDVHDEPLWWYEP